MGGGRDYLLTKGRLDWLPINMSFMPVRNQKMCFNGIRVCSSMFTSKINTS